MTPSVLIAMPAYGGNVGEKCTVSLFKTAQEFTKLGIRHSLLTVANESLISRGRSRLFSFFYNNTDFDYMIFIDADIGFVPNDIIKLLELNQEFTCAGVPLKSIDPKYNFGILSHNDKMVWNAQRTAFEVGYVGTAFMMLHRNVYKKMAEAYPQLKYYPTKTHSNKPASDAESENTYYLFQPEIINGDLKSEDYSFCEKWRKINGKIWLRPDIQLNHTGSHVFEGINLSAAFNNKE